MSDHILRPKTIPDRPKFLAPVLRPQLDDGSVNDRVDPWRKMPGGSVQPFLNVEVTWAIEWDGVSVEEIGHDDEVAIGGELIGDKLGVVEFVADDVGEAWEYLSKERARVEGGVEAYMRTAVSVDLSLG